MKREEPKKKEVVNKDESKQLENLTIYFIGKNASFTLSNKS